MSKYDSLKAHLQSARGIALTMSFEEIAELVDGLPDSAYGHQAWWANEQEGRHVQARSWMMAGYITEAVDLGSRRATFRRDE